MQLDVTEVVQDVDLSPRLVDEHRRARGLHRELALDLDESQLERVALDQRRTVDLLEIDGRLPRVHLDAARHRGAHDRPAVGLDPQAALDVAEFEVAVGLDLGHRARGLYHGRRSAEVQHAAAAELEGL